MVPVVAVVAGVVVTVVVVPDKLVLVVLTNTVAILAPVVVVVVDFWLSTKNRGNVALFSGATLSPIGNVVLLKKRKAFSECLVESQVDFVVVNLLDLTVN